MPECAALAPTLQYTESEPAQTNRIGRQQVVTKQNPTPALPKLDLTCLALSTAPLGLNHLIRPEASVKSSRLTRTPGTCPSLFHGSSSIFMACFATGIGAALPAGWHKICTCVCAASVFAPLYQESKQTEYLHVHHRVGSASRKRHLRVRSVSICTFVPVKQVK